MPVIQIRALIRSSLCALTCALAACSGRPTDLSTPQVTQRNLNVASALPPMKNFVASRGGPVYRANAEILRDFLDLSFQMESGRHLPFLTKFEAPIKVSVSGQAGQTLYRDLGHLIARLRAEAKIDIALAQPGETAQIVIEAVPQKKLQRAVPQAACFVVPNVSSWAEFKRNRAKALTDWTKLTVRTRATVIIPSDAAPQEVRDCLHEEVAQALGPLNDLYRLPDSIFNDDNFHTVLTGFDMLILRAYYAPEIYNGMTRTQARAVLPDLLARLNPSGGSGQARPGSFTPQVWNNTIAATLAPRISPGKRANLAAEAVRIAKAQGWSDNRMAFSLFVQGRVTLNQRPQLAIESFVKSGAIYRELYGTSVHAAHVATQMAAFALSAGQYDTAIKMTEEALPAAFAGENAALMSTLMLIQAQALEQIGRGKEAQDLRLDALGWGRYGFGSDRNVRARVNEIRALTP